MTDRIKLRPDALEWREVENEIVALDLRTSTYLAVNRTGAAIWSDLAGGTTREQLVAKVGESFGVDREVAERDVAAFLDSLSQNDLLEPA